MGHINIHYNFKLPDGNQEEYALKLDEKTLELINGKPNNPPDWAKLDYYICPNCTLDSSAYPYCPLALNIAGVVKGFNRILSHDEVVLKVHTEERLVAKKTTAQRALGSFMGLVIAASGCPHTLFFKPMARFHLPLANSDETMYRAVSTYFIAEYFRYKKKGESFSFDLDGLEIIYSNIQTVNSSIAERIRTASTADSSVNAIILLDMYAKAAPHYVQESLEDIKYLFSSFLDAFG